MKSIFISSNKTKINEIKKILPNSKVFMIKKIYNKNILKEIEEKFKEAYKYLDEKDFLLTVSGTITLKALKNISAEKQRQMLRLLPAKEIYELCKENNIFDAKVTYAVAYKENKYHETNYIIEEINGTITNPKGNGWGFDNIFVPEGHKKTWGEMTVLEKYKTKFPKLMTKQYDFIVKDYITGKKLQTLKKKELTKKITKILESINKDDKKQKLIDLGCGFGDELPSKQNFYTYGIDISENMLKEARKTKKYDEIYLQDIHNLIFPNKFFDVILAKHVLHYSFDIPKAINEMIRVTKDNGYLILITCHPLLAYELKITKNYNEKELIHVPLFDTETKVTEISYRFEDYLKPLLKEYDLIYFEEGPRDPEERENKIDNIVYDYALYVLKKR